MANLKYFGECNGEAVLLTNTQHDGSIHAKPQNFSGRCPACNQVHTVARRIEYKAFPSKHECSAKCMNGSLRGTCECSCNGKNHGRGASLFGKPMTQLLAA